MNTLPSRPASRAPAPNLDKKVYYQRVQRLPLPFRPIRVSPVPEIISHVRSMFPVRKTGLSRRAVLERSWRRA